MRFFPFKPLSTALLLLLTLLAGAASAQFKMESPAGEAPGPWLFGTVGIGKGAGGKPATTALKGLAIKLGDHGEAGLCYDLDLCRLAGAWTGWKFVTPMNLMSRGEYPTALGTTVFTAPEGPGFIGGGQAEWTDARAPKFGPLPNVKYRGLHRVPHGLVIAWEIAGTRVLEKPEMAWIDGKQVLLRRFEVAAHQQPIEILLPGWKPEPGGVLGLPPNAVQNARTGFGGSTKAIVLPAAEAAISFTAYLPLEAGAAENLASVTAAVPPVELSRLIAQPSPALWPQTVQTTGLVATDKAESYVLDTIRVPDQNPWNAPMFIGGFDFFKDGRAAVCTFHGDVFIVSGIDGKLENVTWKRYAAGLYHALGLKIVDEQIYVTCRDGLTRLKDLDGDGEAEVYERFNNDLMVTKNFHEFVFDLHTDERGDFIFAKAGPVRNGGRGFDEIMPHHGTLLRVSKDGSKLDVIATGLRAPNGIGVGPHGELTSGDNEGTWTPTCKINWINHGGFYGVVDLAHRTPPPQDYDRPLCWLPKRADNSSGSQVWVTSDRWGPWKDQLLHLSYGKCTLFGVMRQGVDIPNAPDCCSHLVQGGVVQFPFKFESGSMRARFHPLDGQLYVAGLRGWQTTAVKNGCFQRVRYTGAPVRMPIGLQARQDGVEITFTSTLDTKSASDPSNWNVEVWNYLWSAGYGSPEVSTVETGADGKPRPKHDSLEVKSATVSTDEKSVFLEIPGLKPVMQMSIRYHLKSADDVDLKGEVLNTIHHLPGKTEEQSAAAR